MGLGVSMKRPCMLMSRTREMSRRLPHSQYTQTSPMGIGSVGTLDENLREGALPGITNSPHAIAVTAARSSKDPGAEAYGGPYTRPGQGGRPTLSGVDWGPTREGGDSSQVGEKVQVKFVKPRQLLTRIPLSLCLI